MTRVWILLSCLGLALLPATAADAGGRSGRTPKARAGKGLTLVLVLDRSGSMSGLKLARVRQAAAYAISRLRSKDWAAVLAFDTQSRVVSRLGQVGNRKGHLAAVRKVTAGGGTNFLPALQATLKLLKRAPKRNRIHVIFLSDGQSPRRGVLPAVRALVHRRATLSTIALGQGADIAYLGAMARAGKGRAYKTTGTGLLKVCRRELRRLGR